MPNNFRLTGNVYVSKEGSDSNDGLTPETPKLTVQAGLNALTSVNLRLIIGSGEYNETISYFNTGFAQIIVGDGIVKLNGSSINNCFFNIGSNAVIQNINFVNYVNLTLQWSGSFGSPIFNYGNIYIGYATGLNSFGGLIGSITNSIFINTRSSATNYLSYNKCIFINALITTNLSGGNATIYNCYFDPQSSINIFPVGGINSGVFNFNNIQSKIIMNLNGAVSGANSNGVALSFAQHRIDYPTYNVNSISADPKFNDVRNLNFTLQSDSPHIKAANDFVSNIGGTEYAVYRSAASTEFTTGATISGLTLRGNDSYTITSSPTPGTIETAPIQVQSFPGTRPLTKLEWVGSLEFNKSITAGTAGNNNVPDWDTYTSGAGASPDRLTVKMRYSTQSAQPTTNSEWDNGGYWTAGNYELFEINAKPKVDVNGKGNGNPDYVETGSLGDLVPTWIQLNIKLIDTYNP